MILKVLDTVKSVGHQNEGHTYMKTRIYGVPPLLGTPHGVVLFESPEFHRARTKNYSNFLHD